MNILQKIARQIIQKSFRFSVWTIEQFHDMHATADQVAKLREYPVGTLGYDIAKCLDENQLLLVPNYESHDLKHVLLDYPMTPVAEIRMQAFMLGNGNYTLPCFFILTFGVLLLPDEWITLYQDFQRGRKSKPISAWTIEAFADFETLHLRQELTENNYQMRPTFTLKFFLKYSALISIFAGIFGMLFSLPFLFSSNMADLVGAGFSFIGGAILTVGGLLTLSNLTKHHTSDISESTLFL